MGLSDIMQLFSLTTGVWSGVLVALFMLARSMILARADQKRASNEGTTADSKASQLQFERLEKEIERLTARVVQLEKNGIIKDAKITELTALKLEALAERAAERVITTAMLAERDNTIAILRAHTGPDTLVKATEHVAEATGRVADAAEQAVKR